MTTRVTKGSEGVQILFGSFVSVFDNLILLFQGGKKEKEKEEEES